MNKRTVYETDLTDQQWQLLEPLLPPAGSSGRPIEIERREIVNAIFYKLKSGCHWRMLPPGTLWVLPKWQTVYYYFRKWRADGTLVMLHDTLRTQLRTQMGRDPEPMVTSIDSQSVKTTEKGGVHGYDGGKKINESSRYIMVDSQGLLLSVLVHSADIVDHLGGPLLLWRAGLQSKWLHVEVIYADGGYTGPNLAQLANN